MRSLDRCSQCGLGSMITYKTSSKGLSRTRYLRCDGCGEHGKEILRIDHLGRPTFILPLTTSDGNYITTIPATSSEQ